ncbi:MAG: MBL fold metallo-hydrolase [Candidatus Diapherotrites archaeon]
MKNVANMAEVKILIRGYVSSDTGGRTCSTVTLVRDGKVIMVVDPGTLRNPRVLLKKLKKEKLTVRDVGWVCITHAHTDHYRNLGLFQNAKVLDFWGVWDKDTVKDWKRKFSSGIEIINTPGHSDDGITLLVKTARGVVAVCGDVFWKEDFPQRDEYANDARKLAESRKRVLSSADFIIPGHGGVYRVRK